MPNDEIRSMNLFNTDRESTIIDTYFDLFLEVVKEARDQVILKGNVLLNKLLPSAARTTVDLDMQAFSVELCNEVVLPKLEIFASSCVQKKLASSYRIRKATEIKSGGIDVYGINGNKIYSVDISAKKAVLYGIIRYDFKGQGVLGSSIEKIVSDKCLTTLSKAKFRRIKDFYDLYIIISNNLEIDYRKVVSLMLESLGRESLETLLAEKSFTPQSLQDLISVWDKFSLVSPRKDIVLDKPEFALLYSKVSVMYSNIESFLGGKEG